MKKCVTDRPTPFRVDEAGPGDRGACDPRYSRITPLGLYLDMSRPRRLFRIGLENDRHIEIPAPLASRWEDKREVRAESRAS